MNFAKNLLSYFVAKAKRIYGDSFTVYNIHSLLHLADDCHCTQMHKKENEIKCSRDLSIGLIPARHCSLISKKILSVEEFYRKLVILPCKDSYIVLPMIHCYM